MVKIIVVAIAAWIIGAFGWAQIIGSIQNLSYKPSYIFTIILWLAVMGLTAYFAVAKFDCLWGLLVGFGISLLQVLSAGTIE